MDREHHKSDSKVFLSIKVIALKVLWSVRKNAMTRETACDSV